MTACRGYVVSGRVQGVGFRVGARTQAWALGLTGWVRNRDDGAVELLACGEDSALEAMQVWLRSGPALAAVTAVEMTPAPLAEHESFAIC